jgi:hypothetical protein
MKSALPQLVSRALHCLCAAAACAGFPAALAAGGARTLDAGHHHLGIAGEPEWREFEGKTPEGKSLGISFSAHANAAPATLLIRQRGVKLKWAILLNGRRLGWLELNEQPLRAAYPVPAGWLREGGNTLSILSPENANDIFVDGIELDERPPAEALGETRVRVRVVDKDSGAPLPCRVTVADEHGCLAPLIALAPDHPLAVRTGVAYTGDGSADLGLPTGRYTIFATRGSAYGLATRAVLQTAGQVTDVKLAIGREVPTPGFVACDTHIHTFTFSRHGDCTADERALTLAGEGIELAVAAEHNRFVDFSEIARGMGVADRFTPVIGDEVTTKIGHFITFPAAAATTPIPDFKLPAWPALMTSMRAATGGESGVVILNHPRDIHDGFIPFSPENFNAVTGDNLRGPDFTFDAVEVANSGTLQSDFMRSFRDWFALLNHGYRVTAIGSSDSHDVSRFIVGQGRSYVAADGRDPARISIGEACRSIKAGRVEVSLGLFTDLSVDGKYHAGDLATGLGDVMTVRVRVLGPSWIDADRVELFANGVRIREQKIAAAGGAAEKANIEWKIPKPPRDVFLVAIASGPGVTAPCWPIPSPYQPTAGVRDPRVIGATNPIWIDGDGDGHFTAARGYAERIVRAAGTEPKSLIPALASCDAAVAAQAAGLCNAAGADVRGASFAAALESAPAPIREGFAAFAETLGKPAGPSH